MRYFHLYKVGQKAGPLHLTACIFKVSQQIGVIFGTLPHCFVLNTSVNSILNKFITQVARHLAIKAITQFFTCKIQQDRCIQMSISLKYMHRFAQCLSELNVVIF